MLHIAFIDLPEGGDVMHQYLGLLQKILKKGVDRPDRTGTGTRGIFGHQMRFDLSKGFPLLTTKKLHTKSIVYELLWFLRGETNVRWLQEHGVHIWDEWADKNGNLGPVYGAQWRSWPGAPELTKSDPRPNVPSRVLRMEDGDRYLWQDPIDQIANVVEQIRKNPYSRRHIVTAWNPAEVDDMALPPCHVLFQFFVANGKLSCQLYQRSADVFLGVPFNIASYAFLTHMIAHVTGLEVGDFVHTFGDVHLYLNHFDQARLQLTRKPGPLPKLALNARKTSIFDFEFEDFAIVGYEAEPNIKAPIAV